MLSKTPDKKDSIARPSSSNADCFSRFPKNLEAYEYLKKGNSLYASKKYNESIQSYTNGLKLEPNNPHLLHNCSIVLQRLKRYKEAQLFAEKASTCCPNFYTLANHGDVLINLDRLDEALRCYQLALKLSPNKNMTEDLKNKIASISEKTQQALVCKL